MSFGIKNLVFENVSCVMDFEQLMKLNLRISAFGFHFSFLEFFVQRQLSINQGIRLSPQNCKLEFFIQNLADFKAEKLVGGRNLVKFE